MRACITMSLVPEARGGPFVLWDDVATNCRNAAEWGFAGIEIFSPGPEAIAPNVMRPLLQTHQLQLVALGTGAGWLRHQWTLTDADPLRRQAAREFIASILHCGAEHGAATIIGSMQGRHSQQVPRDLALRYLADGLHELGLLAQKLGVTLLYEPLNRFETNLLNRLDEASRFVDSLQNDAVRILADLFHMNIEENDLGQAIRDAGRRIGHVHYVDSNRRAAGYGHMAHGPIIRGLAAHHYQGWLSVEGLPWPDPRQAARQTMASIDYHVGSLP